MLKSLDKLSNLCYNGVSAKIRMEMRDNVRNLFKER